MSAQVLRPVEQHAPDDGRDPLRVGGRRTRLPAVFRVRPRRPDTVATCEWTCGYTRCGDFTCQVTCSID